MGRHKIVREFPVTPKTVKWQDGREKDEIESILQRLSDHMPEEVRGITGKGILWAVRKLSDTLEELNVIKNRHDMYEQIYVEEYGIVPSDDQLLEHTQECSKKYT
jgi:hypothetical protein